MKNDLKDYKDFWKIGERGRLSREVKKSELRKDYIDDSMVIIAPKRNWKIKKEESPQFTKKEVSCQFCRGVNKEKAKEKVMGKDGWEIKVVENIFPAFSSDNKKAKGIQEIIFETPYHRRELADFKLLDIRKIVNTYKSRVKKLGRKKEANFIIVFKNFGERAGASVEHAHSQIFATEIIPPIILNRLEKEAKRESCIYCDIARAERKGPRLIFKDRYFDVISPYASMRSFEVMVIPKRHIKSIGDFKGEEIVSFSRILKNTLKGIKELDADYNFYFYELPKSDKGHLFFKFEPRLNVWAGLELGAGIPINPISPEQSAEHYKKYFK